MCTWRELNGLGEYGGDVEEKRRERKEHRKRRNHEGGRDRGGDRERWGGGFVRLIWLGLHLCAMGARLGHTSSPENPRPSNCE
eukprot:2669609-Rhodomonas_salina.1